jgi:hypothetical protein
MVFTMTLSTIAQSIDNLTIALFCAVILQLLITFVNLLFRYYLAPEIHNTELTCLKERLATNEFVVQTLFDYINNLHSVQEKRKFYEETYDEQVDNQDDDQLGEDGDDEQTEEEAAAEKKGN